MKKHWFLMVVVGTLISFSACKKEEESMIIGTWEVISVEGDGELAGLHSQLFTFYDFFFSIHPSGTDVGIDYSLVAFEYSIKNNTIIFKDEGIQLFGRPSMKISFSGAEKMMWKDKKIKITFEKIS